MAPESTKPGFWRRMADAKWSPVTVMTNEEYAQMLQKKVLQVDAEIAVIDDKINVLREQLPIDHPGQVEVPK